MADEIAAKMQKLQTTLRTADPNRVFPEGMTPTPAPQNPVPKEERVPSLKQELVEAFTEAAKTAYPQLAATSKPAIMVVNKDPKRGGHFQCNDAMALFGRLKGKPDAPKAPRAVAEAIVAGLAPELTDAETGLVAGTTISGPGFVNVAVNPAAVARRVQALLTDPLALLRLAPGEWAGRRVVIDFSSPNVAKEMHVGHLRSTILGDCLSRALEFCGADVLRLNHIGDWGTQFGMLIQYIGDKRPGGLEASTDEDVADLQVLYRAAKARFDEDEDFKRRSRDAVTQLQGGDERYVAAWQRICQASRDEFQKIYDRLGVVLNERGESFYNPRLQATVDDLIARDVAVESDGAKCVFIEGKEVPLMVQKSNGGFGYASTDMAAIKQRIHEERADWLIYITDVGQYPHFELIFLGARKAGYLPEGRDIRIDHVGFGFVNGEDGKKFKSRSGDTVRLVELLDEARDRCVATIRERRPDIGDDELAASAAAMGYGAVKYADLKNNRITSYRFSFDEMLSLQGDTAVYLLYAHARIASIIRKASEKRASAVGADGSAASIEELAKTAEIRLVEPAELNLAVNILRFPDALEELVNGSAPNRLCAYLYELSGFFNQFYTECQVIGSEQEDSRLLLAEATAVVMRQCFQILGITPLYRI